MGEHFYFVLVRCLLSFILQFHCILNGYAFFLCFMGLFPDVAPGDGNVLDVHLSSSVDAFPIGFDFHSPRFIRRRLSANSAGTTAAMSSLPYSLNIFAFAAQGCKIDVLLSLHS
jgi:hypothetical protein